MGTRQYSFSQTMRLKRTPVIAIDEQSKITYINQEFEKEFGWSSDDVKGKSVTIIIPPILHTAHKIGIKHHIAKETKELRVQHADFSVLRKDGSEQWCEHHIVGKKVDGIWKFAATITPTQMPLLHNKPQ